MRDSNGTYALVYIPDGAAVTVNMAKITGGNAEASWYDPRNGTYTTIGTYANSGTKVFDAPGATAEGNDWVLILEKQSGKITPPSIPTNPTATAVSSSQINLSWSASTEDSPFDFERTNSFSASAWIKTPAFSSGERAIFSKEITTAPYTGWAFYVEPAAARVFITNNWTTKVAISRDSAIAVGDNAWHHVAFTYNGTSLASGVNIYVDGNLSNGTVNYDALDSASILNSQPLNIGSYGNGAGNFFNGTIDEARVYNRALSAIEVQALYNAGAGDTTPPSAPSGVTVI